MTTVADLRAALANANAQAFLRVIRHGESNQNDDAYTLLNGGSHFSGFGQHPYAGQSAPPGLAAGAYQFLPHTWARVAAIIGATDFSPASQDLGAVADIAGHAGALENIIAGGVSNAMHALSTEWTSLATMAQATAEAIFTQYGGTLAGAAAPAPPAPQPRGPSMDPLTLISVFGPIISQLIPQVAKIFKPRGTSTDLTAATTVLDTIVKSAGASNVQDAVEKMVNDKDLAATVQQAVVTEPTIMATLEIGEGGIAAARAAAVPPPDAKWWQPFVTPVVWVTFGLFGLLYMSVANMIGMLGSFQGWDANTRSNILFLVVGAAIGAITGYWTGTTQNSGKKDSVIAQQSGATPPAPSP